ncbi:uncharacterized protein LOC115466474 [Microcaecilia unicolor]|uniref:Uncharacterized protein LOC115466474 n=1 Tax=Microcaecilia unicolor TaxID=1415580 RepID=A0A6P7XK38_9AMPH|nr:uncharacterized protein LOC115466474 [Microcaecilia unicolor]
MERVSAQSVPCKNHGANTTVPTMQKMLELCVQKSCPNPSFPLQPRQEVARIFSAGFPSFPQILQFISTKSTECRLQKRRYPTKMTLQSTLQRNQEGTPASMKFKQAGQKQTFQSLHSEPVLISLGPNVFIPGTEPSRPNVFIPGTEPSRPNVFIPGTEPSRPNVFIPGTEPSRPVFTPGTEPSVTTAVATMAVNIAVGVGVLAALILLVAGLVLYFIRRRNSKANPPKINTQTVKENEYAEPRDPGQPTKVLGITKITSMMDKPTLKTGDQHYVNTMLALSDPPDGESAQAPTFQSHNRKNYGEAATRDEGYYQFPKTSEDVATSDGRIYEEPDSLATEAKSDEGQYETMMIGKVEARPHNSHYELICHETLQDAVYKTINCKMHLNGGTEKPTLG